MDSVAPDQFVHPRSQIKSCTTRYMIVCRIQTETDVYMLFFKLFYVFGVYLKHRNTIYCFKYHLEYLRMLCWSTRE